MSSNTLIVDNKFADTYSKIIDFEMSSFELLKVLTVVKTEK